MTFDSAHALLIGVGSYQYLPRLNVPSTAADAVALAEVLRNPQSCAYPSEHVTLLVNQAANREGILAAFDQLATQTSEGDTVLLFYAGHGEYGEDGDYYLTTSDTRLNGKKVVRESGIREAELIAKLRAIKAKRLLLIVNACHAGEISPTLAPSDSSETGTSLPATTVATLLGTGEGRVIITACRSGQFAYIGPGPLTLFTQALVDGLRGSYITSNHGYISLFDLYEFLYHTLDQTVEELIPTALRQQYSEKQEPELTIIKGVGPFAVALARGGEALGSFDGSARPPAGTAVREVKPAYAQMLQRQHQQTIGDNAQIGSAVAGDVHGNITVNQSRRGVIDFGNNNRTGDITIGDIAGRDIIKTGDISGSGIAIGRGARSINTGGGDYAEGNIDKRKGSFVQGDQFNLSGNFSGALLNIKATLSNVSQSIGSSSQGDAASRTELQRLISQLDSLLQQVPSNKTGDAEAVTETVKAAVEQATKPAPNPILVKISAEGLKQAAANLASVLPSVLPLAEKIAAAIQRLGGG